eukprot:5404845-Pleurochrysis_carterae.AAC.2
MPNTPVRTWPGAKRTETNYDRVGITILVQRMSSAALRHEDDAGMTPHSTTLYGTARERADAWPNCLCSQYDGRGSSCAYTLNMLLSMQS